jgi:hypothetical protein
MPTWQIDGMTSSAPFDPASVPQAGARTDFPVSGIPEAGSAGLTRSMAWSGLVLFPFRLVYWTFQLASLVMLLAIASSIPILQFASLGYMLEVARRISFRYSPVGSNSAERLRLLPGLDRASRIGVMAAGAFLTWLPVWLIADYAYSAQLIEGATGSARALRVLAWIASLAWLVHVGWAAMRGGKWFHFLWPAPWRFVREIGSPQHWRNAEDGLWQYTIDLQLGRLIWLGFRATVGGLLWLLVPGTLMILGLQAHNQPGLVILGIVGAVSMLVVLQYLPFLQVHMARENRFRAIFDVGAIRRSFARAPWAYCISFVVTIALAIPLYLFRIESLPRELLWVPCLFFVLFSLPSRFLAGWAVGRGHVDRPRRFFLARWMAWMIQVATLPVYVLFLYLATLASWDGLLTLFLQHAFLVPVPLAGN